MPAQFKYPNRAVNHIASISALLITFSPLWAIDFSTITDPAAATFLQADARGDEALKKFEETEEIDGSNFSAAFRKSVAIGIKLEAGGIDPNYEQFGLLIGYLRTHPEEKIERILNSESVRLFISFRKSKTYDAKTWKEFLAKNHVSKKPFLDAFERVLKIAQDLESDSIAHDNKHYANLIRGNVAMPTKTIGKTKTQTGPAPKPVNHAEVKLTAENEKTDQINKASRELWREGLELYEKLTRAQQQLLPEKNAVAALDLVDASRRTGPRVPPPAQIVINDSEGKPQAATKNLPVELNAADELLMGLALTEREVKRRAATKAADKVAAAEKAKTESANDAPKLAKAEKALAAAQKEAAQATAAADFKGSLPDDVVKKSEQLARLNVIEAAPFGNERDGIIRFFQFGVRKLSPYSVTTVTTGQDANMEDIKGQVLEPAKDDTTSFVEFVYSNRWAWNLERLSFTDDPESFTDTHGLSIFTSKDKSAIPLLSGHRFDFDARFSYNLDQTSGSTTQSTETDDDAAPPAEGENLTAAGIAGGSDIAIGLNLGYHLFRHRFANGAAYAVTLDGGYELSSSRRNFDAHHRAFAGLGYSANFDVPGGFNRPALFSARAGWSGLDNFVYSTTENEMYPRLLELDRGAPRFKFSASVSLETELIYPLGRDSLITMSGRIHGKTDPNLWFVQIAYSRPISSFIGGLFDFGEAEDAKPLINPAERTPTTGGN